MKATTRPVILLALFGVAQATFAADPVAIVDALKTNSGNPKGARASFAKGQCVRGTYTPTKEAASVTKSLSFTKPSNVLARFSVGGGNPKVSDTNKTALRGFSMKLGEGKSQTDILFENAPVHFAKTMDQMLEFLHARTPGADGKPDAAKVKAFSEANPETLNQAHFVAGKPLPGSFAGVTYWGVHSFPATNAKGAKRFIKFRVVPVAGEITQTEDEAKGKADDFLFRDLQDRIAQGGVQLKVQALLDRPGDPTMDVTQRWPDEDNREAVTLGTVTLNAMAENESCDASIFAPGNLAAGIGEPPDEMFAGRKLAYPISLARRKSE